MAHATAATARGVTSTVDSRRREGRSNAIHSQNSGFSGCRPQSAGDIEESIQKLGFKPQDIRPLLITHAHIDHAGTTAHFMQLSGATVAMMDRDFEHLKSGGKTDPVYGAKPPFYFPPVTAERVLKEDGTTLSVGKISR